MLWFWISFTVEDRPPNPTKKRLGLPILVTSCAASEAVEEVELEDIELDDAELDVLLVDDAEELWLDALLVDELLLDALLLVELDTCDELAEDSDDDATED